MDEIRANEQCFFTPETLDTLVRFLARYDRVCVLCAPLLGQALVEAGRTVSILDIDDRFSQLEGFRHWDVARPEYLQQTYDIIVCDPPFFNVSLSELFRAIRMLAQAQFEQPLLVSYLRRRKDAVLGAFTPFHLEPTGYRPRYVTVQEDERNEIEFFGNLGDAAHLELSS